MKKFIFLLLPLFIFLFSNVCFAYTGPSEQDKEKLTEIFTDLGYSGDFHMDTDNFKQQWDYFSLQGYSFYVATWGGGLTTFVSTNASSDDSNVVLRGYRWCQRQTSGLWSVPYAVSSTATIPNNGYFFSSYEAFSNIELEFDNILYDPSIPTPSSVYSWNNYKPGSDNSFGVEQFVGSVSYPEDLYFAYYIKVWTPKEVIISRSGNSPSFKTDSYYSHEPFYFNSYLVSEKVPSSAFTIAYDDEETLMQWWNNIADNLDISFSGMTGDWSSVLGTTDPWYPQNDFIRMHGDAVFNKLEISTCFFVIRDGQIYSGMWEVWNNSRPYNTSLAQLSNSIQVSGTQVDGSSSDLFPEQAQSNAENVNQTAPDNINSGNNFTVNVNTQQVPNNMDYPTIVSYNHDNIFTGFIDTYKTAGNTLGDFAEFCSQTLVWIPSQIWSIIAIGFSMAIVIMIIKIL